MPIDEILSRLQKVHKVSGGYIACCPAHEDSNPSMSVTERDGKILLHCHAGCSTEAVVSAIGLKMSDLMPERDLSPIQRAARKARTKPRAVARYDYQYEDGEIAYSVIRYEPKTFRQCHYDEHGSPVWKMDGVVRVPYHLPEVEDCAMHHGEIFVVEGEKDVETLRKMGFVATCNAGGAGKWDDAWVKYFEGASKVTVIADNDPAEKGFPGQKHAWQIHTAMKAAGIDSTVAVMPTGKDVTEWAEKASARSGEDFIRAVASASPWPEKWRFTASETAAAVRDWFITPLSDFPDYIPEEKNPDILVKGRWLERGGSAWIVSTAGTGKSIHSEQTALSWTAGMPFSGLSPLKPLKMWIIQSEDSPSRVVIDREDIIAELTDTNPEIDWREVSKEVKFVKFPGKVGADFLDALDIALGEVEEKPDVIILNPFMAFIGGPVSDGSYVTPFLRGGELNRQPTCGLQDILERHHVAALIYHHTPKPPTEKELKAWMSSTFPEYQGAGSSDITNWGRSFITMMKVENHPGMVCLTAGKNGNELGWDEVGGARRHYLAYSNEGGITGRGRHAWRELDEDEIADVTQTARDHLAEDAETITKALMEAPHFFNELHDTAGRERYLGGMSKKRMEDAWRVATEKENLKKHDIYAAQPRGNQTIYGPKIMVEQRLKMMREGL